MKGGMMIHDKGIETAEVFLSTNLFQRAYRAADKGQERELKRILAGQYRSRPRPDPMDIIDVSWGAAPASMKREGISVVATIEIARGHRVLADFVTRHSLDCAPPDAPGLREDGAVVGCISVGYGESEAVAECSCGESVELSRQSLRRHSWEDDG